MLGLLVVTVYANSFPGSFHYDDFGLMLENPLVTGAGLSGLDFLQNYGGRPLTLLSFRLNYLFFGEAPFSYHLFNVLLHLAVTVGLFILCRRWRGTFFAFLTAAFFAAHPMQAQAVNYIWSRSILLMALFAVAALLSRSPAWRVFWQQLAIWSRAEALVLAVPLALLDRKRWKLPVAVSVVNGLLLIGLLVRIDPRQVGWNFVDPLAYWKAAVVGFWQTLPNYLVPSHFAVDHGFMDPGLAWVLLGVAGFVGLAFLLRVQNTVLRVGTATVLLSLAPSLLIPNTDPISQPRWYVAGAGLAVLVAGFGLWFLSRRWLQDGLQHVVGQGYQFRRVSLTAAVLTLLLAAWVPVTRERNRIWKDDVALWREAVRLHPDNGRAVYNLGVALVRSDELEEAAEWFRRGCRLNPGDGFNYAALGYYYEVKGDPDRALLYYRQAVQLDAESPYARRQLERLEGL